MRILSGKSDLGRCRHRMGAPEGAPEICPARSCQAIGVSTYRVTRQLPEPLRDEIPSIEYLQGVVEKLLRDLKERKNLPDISLSDAEDE